MSVSPLRLQMFSPVLMHLFSFRAIAMGVTRGLLYLTSLFLAGCIFGYYQTVPEDSRGDFVVNSEGVGLEPCTLDPTLSDGGPPGTCITTLLKSCNGCVVLPAGTAIKVLRVFVGGGGSQDVVIEVGTGSDRKRVHALRNWASIRQRLSRP